MNWLGPPPWPSRSERAVRALACATLRGSRGFTLIELAVTLTVLVLLGMLVVPDLVETVDAGRTAVLVNQFPQDVAWARNQAVTTQQPVRMTLGPGCAWSIQTGAYQADGSTQWTTQNAHSMTAGQVAAQFPNVNCPTLAAALTVNFNGQGFLDTAVPKITVSDAHGQNWTLLLLMSGSVITNADTAS